MVFLEQYAFKYPWRAYQAKVLHELSQHLSDRKLNIVAAPGAGKTVLGLEVVRRLNKNVLILSPTITIKNQWVDRFLELFVQDETPPDFISADIYNLSRFNVATYQALHYAQQRKRLDETLEPEEENEKSARATQVSYDLIAALKAQDIQVVVLDEAHHLRAAWWKSLTDVLGALDGVHTISLTATPPYDVDRSEWNRYIDICGPIDYEITVPQLVATGDLCAHQDFVIFNKLSPDEAQQVAHIEVELDLFVRELCADQALLQSIADKPEMVDYAAHEETVLDNPRYYSSLLVFLHSAGRTPDGEIVDALGGGAPIPALDAAWLEILLQGILYDDKDFIAANRPLVKQLYTRLNAIGGVNRGSVTVQFNEEIRRIMAGSTGKMSSIADIALHEHATLGQDLSMVILADYVRKEALRDTADHRIGVVPIFKRIVRDIGVTPHADSTVADKIASIAVVSGKLKIIPATLLPLVQAAVPCEACETGMEGYVELKTTDRYEHELVRLFTRLMNEKKIHILIGTVALLGEGWDCQAINSLVLASFVGSYMLSNQIRGRAIRMDVTKHKVANIWHLVSLTEGDASALRQMHAQGEYGDYRLLRRRFRSFIGIAYSTDEISSGIDRLDVLQGRHLASEYAEINKEMYRISRTRQSTKKRWEEILARFGNADIEIVHTIKSPVHRENWAKPLVLLQSNRTGRYAVSALVGWGMVALGVLGTPVLYGVVGAAGIASSVVTVKLAQNVGRALRRLSPVWEMKKVGDVVLACLRDMELVYSKQAAVTVRTQTVADTKYCEIELLGASNHENNLFIQSMREIYERIDNPRYLILFETKSKVVLGSVSVPSVFSAHKAEAQRFQALWQRWIGPCKLVYTRNAEGRQVLLRARKGSYDYSERFTQQQKAIKRSSWK